MFLRGVPGEGVPNRLRRRGDRPRLRASPARGRISQGDRQVTICNREIARAQWPGPPRANDRCVIDGRSITIQACDTRWLRNEIVLHLIQVRG